MIGAILGDMIGAPYEFDRGGKTKDFPLFSAGSEFTDDTVMTIAVADALLRVPAGEDVAVIRENLIDSMHHWGELYPNAGYGGMFCRWLHDGLREPYGSFGNGSAMRVSSVGWLYESIEETRRIARLTAEVTHNHPEGIKGAEATAAAIYLARTKNSKDEIKDYITKEFGYDLSRTCGEIRPGYHHVETCQQTVPEAITAFLEGESFEDVIRTGVSLGGDCDTLTCIAGGIAEAFYFVPQEIEAECRKRLPKDMLEVLDQFKDKKSDRREPIIWYELGEDLNPVLVKEIGKRITTDEKSDFYDMTIQSQQGWQRSILYVEAIGVWDLTAFSATMDITIAYGPDDEGRCYTFTSCEQADRWVYRKLDKKQIEECRRNVDAFYDSPDLQKRWQQVILHPVCLILRKDGSLEPIPISELDPSIIDRFYEKPLWIGGKEDFRLIFDVDEQTPLGEGPNDQMYFRKVDPISSVRVDVPDPLFADAARKIIKNDKASIGFLQRSFGIGFSRAARIMDQLENAGIVGPDEGIIPRRIMITQDELEKNISTDVYDFIVSKESLKECSTKYKTVEEWEWAMIAKQPSLAKREDAIAFAMKKMTTAKVFPAIYREPVNRRYLVATSDVFVALEHNGYEEVLDQKALRTMVEEAPAKGTKM